MQVKQFEELQFVNAKVTFGAQTMDIHVFYIDGLMIDTGPMRKKAQLVPLFRTWDIDQVVLTHHHEDHTGLAKWVQDHLKVPMYMHEKGVDICAGKQVIPFYRKTFWGVNESFQALPVADQFTSRNDQWEAIHTPGHAEDHIVLLNKDKGWLFGGDLYVSSRPKSMFAFESFGPMVESLAKALTLDFDVYICSHIGVLPNGRKYLQEKLDYLIDLQGNIVRLHEKGHAPREIRKILLPKKHPMHYLSFFENSPMHLIHSVLASYDAKAGDNM